MRAAKAMASLCICTGSPEPPLLENAISTYISCVGPCLLLTQSVTCLTTDAYLAADPGIASSIPAWSHTIVEIDHEIISTAILLPFAD